MLLRLSVAVNQDRSVPYGLPGIAYRARVGSRYVLSCAAYPGVMGSVKAWLKLR